MARSQPRQGIPTKLSKEQFEQFILPHLSKGSRSPETTLSFHAIFNYICACSIWVANGSTCPSKRIGMGVARSIRQHLSYRMRWQAEGCFDAIFEGSVLKLHQDNRLDLSVIHGDGTTTAAKKGGDNIGYSGHKKVKGDKAVVFCDRHCNVIAPLVAAAGNRNESPMLRQALPQLTKIARALGLDLQGSIMSLDGVYDCPHNRKAIFNRGMVPNINPNPRGRKHPKRGRKPLFDPAIFEERFRTIERLFAWEDKFRRLLFRFERISQLHYAFKTLAYTMVNLRHYCQG
jgi:hypothetical protein